MNCAFSMLIFLVALSSQGSRSHFSLDADPRQREGVLEYAWKRVNPRDIDYGARTDQVRHLIVEQSIKNLESWLVMVSSSFLGFAFCVIAHQHRERKRRELIVAKFLAQYHNAWVDARGQAQEAISRYNLLVAKTKTGAVAATTPEAQVDGGHGSAETAPPPQNGEAAPSGTVPPALGSNTAERSGTAGAGDYASEEEPASQIQSLTRQLQASYNRERSLQRLLGRAPSRPAPRATKGGEAPA